ncbi:MAG: helix-turn-helix transcriptional regulator [Actinomycetota bacterium]
MTAAELTPDEFAAAVAAVTSAFGDPTRRDVYLFVRGSAEGATAAEVAAQFSLHSNVARHHLEKLAGGGYVDVEFARHEAAGRPSKRYRARAHDTHLAFPPRRDDLLGTLLARALEKLPTAEAATLAEQVGYEYGLSIAQRMEPGEGHRSVKAALGTVADALTAHGFAAHAEARGTSLTLVAEHCPFGEAASKYPHVLCAVDTGMIKGMLEGLYGETSPRIEESRPGGDAHCVTRV